MSGFRVIIGSTLILMVVIFTLQNTEVVSVSFLFWKFSLSRVLLVFILLFAGIGIGWVLNSIMHHAKKSRK